MMLYAGGTYVKCEKVLLYSYHVWKMYRIQSRIAIDSPDPACAHSVLELSVDEKKKTPADIKSVGKLL